MEYHVAHHDFVDWDTDDQDMLLHLPNNWDTIVKEEENEIPRQFDIGENYHELEANFLDDTNDEEFDDEEDSFQYSIDLDSSILDDDQGKSTKRGRSKAKETDEERKVRMAAACRKFRAKRKEELSSLREKNKQLEDERESYLSRIAELQTEAQSLRDHGTVDIQRENELLRSEIRKYKRFIQGIVSAVNSMPLITEEEKLRLLQEGITGALGQVIGLAYTSAGDPNWKWAKSQIIDGQLIHVKYQYLPLGIPSVSAKRLNLRIDIPGLSESIDQLEKKFSSLWFDENIVRQIILSNFPELLHKTDFKMKELFPVSSSKSFETNSEWEKSNIRLFHVEETIKQNQNKSDLIVGFTKKHTEIFSSAYPFMDDYDGAPLHDSMNDGPMSAVILVVASTTSITKHVEHVEPMKEGVNRVAAPMLEGYILRRGKHGKSHVTFVTSYPLQSEFMCWSSFEKELLHDDGSTSEVFGQILKTMISLIST